MVVAIVANVAHWSQFLIYTRIRNTYIYFLFSSYILILKIIDTIATIDTKVCYRYV
jgi:hypothetical protein